MFDVIYPCRQEGRVPRLMHLKSSLILWMGHVVSVIALSLSLSLHLSFPVTRHTGANQLLRPSVVASACCCVILLLRQPVVASALCCVIETIIYESFHQRQEYDIVYTFLHTFAEHDESRRCVQRPLAGFARPSG